MPHEIVQALKSLQGFNALRDAVVEQIVPYASVRAVRVGETVFCQGEPSPYCFGVLAGEVVIQHVSKDSRFPPKVLGVVGPGGLFGESSIFEDTPRVAMATASKDGKLAVIRGDELRGWIRRTPEAAQPLLMALLQTSLGRLHQTSHELAVLHGVGRIMGSGKPFAEQLGALLEFLKVSIDGMDDLIFYQRSPYWEEFAPVNSLPHVENLPAIPLQNELVQKVNTAGAMQIFSPAAIRGQMDKLQWPWESRRTIAAIPLFDWDKASDPLQGLLFVASARREEAFSGGAKLLLTSIAYPMAEALSRQSRQEDAVARVRLEQSKKSL